MKALLTLIASISFLTLSSQTVITTNFENIQGKWICVTPKYKKHTFWVKNLSFFQYHNQDIVEQELPYQIEKSKGENIDIVGLFVKCSGCYDDVWTITKLTSTLLELVNNETDETVTYNKVLSIKKKEEKRHTTKGLAILGFDGIAMNNSKSIFLSSRARQNAVQLKNLQ